MRRTGTELTDRFTVSDGSIPHVPGEAVLWVTLVQCRHEPVAIDFCHDRSRGDRVNVAITLDEGRLWLWKIRQGASINQYMIGKRRELA